MRQGTLLIVILITGILFWGGVFYFMFRPDNPGKRAVEVAELALKASVDNPESVRVIGISKADSVLKKRRANLLNKLSLQ